MTCKIFEETGQVPLDCLFDCKRGCVHELPPAPVSKVRCNRCGSTDVYWMTVVSQREARFQHAITADPAWVKACKPRLFNIAGGEHVCPIDDSAFTASE